MQNCGRQWIFPTSKLEQSVASRGIGELGMSEACQVCHVSWQDRPCVVQQPNVFFSLQRTVPRLTLITCIIALIILIIVLIINPSAASSASSTYSAIHYLIRIVPVFRYPKSLLTALQVAVTLIDTILRE